MPQELEFTIGGASGSNGADGADGLDGLSVPGGRLTLATGDPLPQSDQTAKTTVYYTPYLHGFIPLWNGTAWVRTLFSEVSIVAPSTTSTPFDVFGSLSGGNLVLATSNWTNDTTRATALARNDGYWTLTGSKTSLYLGTCRTTGSSGNCEDSVTRRLVWNMYNRHRRSFRKTIAASGYTYSTNSYRSQNADTANRVDFIVGLRDAALEVHSVGLVITTAAEFASTVGLGLDSTTANAAAILLRAIGVANAGVRTHAFYQAFPTAGYHFLQMLELGAGIGTQTWFNDTDGGLFGFFQG